VTNNGVHGDDSLGDCSYASVWGLTDADEPVWLVTDFNVVSA